MFRCIPSVANFLFYFSVIFVLGVSPATSDERTNTQSIVPAQFALANTFRPNLKPKEWSAIATAGNVRFRAGENGSWNRLYVGAAIGPASQVKSGPAGWTVLARGEDRMVVGARTSMALGQDPTPGLTRVFQNLGNILFKVDRKAVPQLTSTGQPQKHFYVETPYLIVGVKGTTFGVNVGNNRASVSVSEGVVGVSTTENGSTTEVDVTVGQTASVSHDGGPGATIEVNTTAKNRAVTIPERGKAKLRDCKRRQLTERPGIAKVIAATVATEVTAAMVTAAVSVATMVAIAATVAVMEVVTAAAVVMEVATAAAAVMEVATAVAVAVAAATEVAVTAVAVMGEETAAVAVTAVEMETATAAEMETAAEMVTVTAAETAMAEIKLRTNHTYRYGV